MFISFVAMVGFILLSATVGDKLIGEWRVSKIVDHDSKKSIGGQNLSLVFQSNVVILLFKSGDRVPMQSEWS